MWWVFLIYDFKYLPNYDGLIPSLSIISRLNLYIQRDFFFNDGARNLYFTLFLIASNFNFFV